MFDYDLHTAESVGAISRRRVDVVADGVAHALLSWWEADMLGDAYLYLGMIQEKQGKKAEAKKSYEQGQKISPASKQLAEALKRVS